MVDPSVGPLDHLLTSGILLHLVPLPPLPPPADHFVYVHMLACPSPPVLPPLLIPPSSFISGSVFIGRPSLKSSSWPHCRVAFGQSCRYAQRYYSEDGKSIGEFNITRGLRSERERVCVCVCDGDPRLHSRDENVQTRGGARAITIRSGFRHCLLLKRDRNEYVRVCRTDND